MQVQSIISEAFRFLLTIIMNVVVLVVVVVVFCFDTVENQVLIFVT